MSDYTDLTASFIYADVVRWALLDALAENDNYLKDHGWEDGCNLAFGQADVPTGWTKVTSAGINDSLMRIVSGSSGGSTGGSHATSDAITLAHDHDLDTEAAHTHDTAHEHDLDHSTTAELYYTSFGGGVVKPSSTSMIPSSPLSYGTSYSWLLTHTDETDVESGSDGSHDHGGSTGSALSDVTLAYFDVVVGTKDAGSGFTDESSAFYFLLDIGDCVDDFNALGANDEYNHDRLTPDGTAITFYQAVAPSGWTKGVAVDGKALRIVTGSGGGTGGSHDVASSITLAHSNHSVAASSDHTHTVGSHDHDVAQEAGHPNIAGSFPELYLNKPAGYTYVGWGVATSTPNSNYPLSKVLVAQTSTLESDGAHDHTLSSELSNVSLAYVNVILCTKDAEAAGYTDMSTFFVADNLLAWQDMDALAENDDVIKGNQMEAGSTAPFFQATAPLNWTKSTLKNDVVARITSGAGGGGGGSHGVSSSITLSHTHTISEDTHDHSVAAHAHNAQNNTEHYLNIAADGVYAVVVAGKGPYMHFAYRDVGPDEEYVEAWIGTATSIYSETVEDIVHDHGGNTDPGVGSPLSNVSLAYSDFILCVKS